jgi:hypothetical protein
MKIYDDKKKYEEGRNDDIQKRIVETVTNHK